MYGALTTQTALASETADSLLWAKLTTDAVPEFAHASARIAFDEHTTARPLRAALDAAAQCAPAQARLVVVAGRSRQMVAKKRQAELQQLCAEKGAQLGSEVAKTLGDVACGFVASGSSASLLVVQTAQGR